MVKKTFIILLLGVMCLLLINSVIALPSGANYTDVNTTTSTPTDPQSYDAHAGNVTEITITGDSATASWQGFYGNVSGVIQLADSAKNVMYNWSQLNPSGEIYASKNGTITWSYVQCFNFTANGSYFDDTAQAGATSLYGMNLTQLEASFNITTGDSDSVDNTFVASSHPMFYTNGKKFDTTECKSVKLLNSTGNGDFDEVLLYEPTGRSVIFTSLLKSNADGFNGATHDFEMVVLEDGHNGDISPDTYYFYLEIA
jgi:hypothetical protein